MISRPRWISFIRSRGTQMSDSFQPTAEHGTPEDDTIKPLLEKLTGQLAPFDGASENVTRHVLAHLGKDGLGYSQLNELLLAHGFDRVTHAFFKFLIDGTTEYEHGDAFSSIEELRQGILRFRKRALILYGNVKFAFKSLSRNVSTLTKEVAESKPTPVEDFERRHSPILSIESIPAEEAYLTGYFIEEELKKKLKEDPNDEEAGTLEKKRLEIVAKAIRNQHAYLLSDHLDVYVATSMRERHEFVAINRLTSEIFGHKLLKPLKLRWFDPTQAYCVERIDKGLSEALMLRRAACTIYLAQESDTLGKDSELASTMAQGKPVIAYLPEGDEQYVDSLISSIQADQPDRGEIDLLLEQLRVFDATSAWSDGEVRNWCQEPSKASAAMIRDRLKDKVKKHYNKRADALMKTHPLGIQVNVATGVANGVLVVRNVNQCAKLVRRILTGTLKFDLEEGSAYTALRERISGCIFRVMTADAMLTNAFWNFYIKSAE